MFYDSNNVAHGFLYDNGKYITLDDPVGVIGTLAFGINNSGEIVGWYTGANNLCHGFLALA